MALAILSVIAFLALIVWRFVFTFLKAVIWSYRYSDQV